MAVGEHSTAKGGRAPEDLIPTRGLTAAYDLEDPDSGCCIIARHKSRRSPRAASLHRTSVQSN